MLGERITNVTLLEANDYQSLFSSEDLALLRKCGLNGMGEAYINQTWTPKDLRACLTALVASESKNLNNLNWQYLKYVLDMYLKNPQRGEGAFEVGKRHYDLGNDLFQAMLDKSLTYTCGYWRNASNLDEAQEEKLKLLCEKLQLTAGQRVLDIGCGWGNFAYYAAKNYGVSVVGLTISKEQAAFARERCKDLPVEIRLEDFHDHKGVYDRVVSIEMIEAVGKKNISSFFKFVNNSLKPNGLFALQVISAETFNLRSNPALNQFVLWLLKYIFPNGYLPNAKELFCTQQGFVIEDVHNFSADYELTLAAWEENFLTAWPQLEGSKYDQQFYRIWRYYLCGCMAMFHNRIVQLYQIVYSKDGVKGGYLYR